MYSQSHHCCTLFRNLSLPLNSRVSKWPVSFSDRFCSKSIRLLQSASVSCAAEQNNTAIDPVGRRRDTKLLPEPISRRSREEKPPIRKKNGVRSIFSPWEDSAETYFSKNGETKFKNETEKEDEFVSEPADSPRWNRIKTKYSDFTDSKSEKEDLRRWSKIRRKEAAESSLPRMVGECVYGFGPVMAALTVSRREFYALYIQEGLDLTSNSGKKKDRKGIEKILKLADKIRLKIIEASKHDLNMVVDNRPHQGLVLDASPLETVDIRELDPVAEMNQSAPVWVALDEVTDPQNLGAIIRSAYFFGAEGVVLCAKNSAPLSGVVGKASAGSLELIELRSCKNMMKFLAGSAENGWRVLGGSVSSKAVALREVEGGFPTIVVLGSEGRGLRALVERSCTQLIRIPGAVDVGGVVGEGEEGMVSESFGRELDDFLAVESLNVSVAAGVLLYHLVGDYKRISVEKMKGISS